MVPTYREAVGLWKTYHLPQNKQQHSLLVAKLAVFFASKLQEKKQITIQINVLLAAALLHDIDKNIPQREGERHPDTGVRILTEIGMDEVAQVVKTHPLHAILDSKIAPRTWEEKILFLSDKMVKYDIISVEERFSLWRNEQLPKKEQELLIAAFPKVKEFEQFVCTTLGLTPTEVIQLAKQSILGDKGELL
jgi:putative nucleotidyltransferase with HDIG domain